MALTGAYVLAGELHAADGDHEAAYQAYEQRLREHVTVNQAILERTRDRFEVTEADPEGMEGFDRPGVEVHEAFRAATVFDLVDY
ncbi:hypothetical protein [Kitasatospora sp. NBC_01300]|uniref:hypothetical protein n=1 Tax=Kitasatospora sp. NBC_01300 TaxID=2903574 RepID=UPI00352DC1A8|nr:hypothetical protein OG556_04045 [Kitasatospora sp. NBC_01300]